MQEALEAPQVAFRETLGQVEEEGIGTLELFNLTAKFSKTPGRVESPPPRLSAHTNEVLSGMGYTEEEIEELKKQGVI